MKRCFLFGLVAVTALGCQRPKKFEADVQVNRWSVVRKDDSGKVMTSDLEVSFVECPGDQIDIIRGGAEFSACVASKIKVGDKVHVKLDYHWNEDGFWDYDITDVQGCVRARDPNDEASYKMVRECRDWEVNGARVGFQCSYTNKTELNKKCPWFKRH